MIFPLPLFKRLADLSFLCSFPSLISETPSTDPVSGNVKPSCHRAAKKNYPTQEDWRLCDPGEGPAGT